MRIFYLRKPVFHAQQAVEKALKAVLLFKRIEFPFTHDIEELLEIAQQGGLTLSSGVNEAGILTPYAVEARYPGQVEEISFSDVEEAIRIAEDVLKWVQEIIRTS